MIEIKQADRNNFCETSMDSFDRFQEVQNVWRIENGRLVLEFHPFTETWSPEQRRKKAGEILSGRYITFCAFEGDAVVGEIMLIPELNENRLIIDSFHVSREFRRCGIGRRLVETVADYASFFTGNDASRRVMEKCGMAFDHFSEKELTYLGSERDLTYYAIHRKPERSDPANRDPV